MTDTKAETKSEPKFVKVKMHLTGDVRTVPAGDAHILFKTKRASPVRQVEREKAVK